MILLGGVTARATLAGSKPERKRKPLEHRTGLLTALLKLYSYYRDEALPSLVAYLSELEARLDASDAVLAIAFPIAANLSNARRVLYLYLSSGCRLPRVWPVFCWQART